MQANPIDTTKEHWLKHGSVLCGHLRKFAVGIYSSYFPEYPGVEAGVRLCGSCGGFVGLEMELTPDAALALADALKAAAATAREVQAAADAARAVAAQKGGAA